MYNSIKTIDWLNKLHDILRQGKCIGVFAYSLSTSSKSSEFSVDLSPRQSCQQQQIQFFIKLARICNQTYINVIQHSPSKKLLKMCSRTQVFFYNSSLK